MKATLMKWTVTLTRMEVTMPAVSDLFRHFVLICCFSVSSFCSLCVHSVILLSCVDVTKKPPHIVFHLTSSLLLCSTLTLSRELLSLSSFSPHCESFTLPHFLNWETRHSIAGQWVIGFQRRLKLETLIPRISESRELQIPYHLH